MVVAKSKAPNVVSLWPIEQNEIVNLLVHQEHCTASYVIK